jgi:hypothetical protein
MNIDDLKLSVRDLVNGYSDDGEAEVYGYGGKLDIRPPYQREFIYKDKQRDAVTEIVTKDFPLNVTNIRSIRMRTREQLATSTWPL